MSDIKLPKSQRADNVNIHGINMTYFNKRFRDISRNLSDYRPMELARDLAKLAHMANEEAAVNKINLLVEENHTSLKDT